MNVWTVIVKGLFLVVGINCICQGQTQHNIWFSAAGGFLTALYVCWAHGRDIK